MTERLTRKPAARSRRKVWIRDSEARERRVQLAAKLRGWWKLWHPFKA